MKRIACLVFCLAFVLSGAIVYGQDAHAASEQDVTAQYLGEVMRLMKELLTDLQALHTKLEAAEQAENAEGAFSILEALAERMEEFGSSFSLIVERYDGRIAENAGNDSEELQALFEAIMLVCALIEESSEWLEPYQ